ncbi:hypothetical protein ABFA07_007806 [Porites harrisoni]
MENSNNKPKSNQIKSKANKTVVRYSTTADGLNMKFVSLASHKMVPSKFEDCFKKDGKQAKQLAIEYKAEKAFSIIADGRKEHETSAPRPTKIVSALGSEEEVYSVGADCGMFAAVCTAYSHHYRLRTSPDDWWFCVIKRVACAIDQNSSKASVRNLFVDHEGKKTIEVQVEDLTIYTVDYNFLFDQITKQLKENLKVSEFVDGVTADFGTTSAVQKIVSQITLIYSVNQYFDCGVMTMCGIPAVEMLGSEEDWMKLSSKLKVLRTLLEPIENDLGLSSKWWDLVQKVFWNLQTTYQGHPDEDWWSHIMSYEEAHQSGIPAGGIKGWITDFLEGPRYARALWGPGDFTSGVVAVPFTIKDRRSGVQDTAALVAGMLGFTVHRIPNCDEVSVQPFQGWSLMLSDDSPFCKF